MKNHKGDNAGSRRSRRRGKHAGSDASSSEVNRAESSSTDVVPTTAPTLPAAVEAAPRVSASVATMAPVAVTAESPAAATENAVDHAAESSPASEPNRARAEQIVQEYVTMAVGAAMIPLPGVDLAAVGGLQLKVLAALARHYGVPFTRQQAQLIVTSLLGSVGTTVLAGAALVSLAKILPGVGSLVGVASVPIAGGVVTRALGHLAIDHFERGGTMEDFDLDVAQQAFLAKIAEARAARA